jgi:hypothetical protein
MALPITVPFTFANVTTTQNLSSLDTDFAVVYNAVNGIGNGTVALSNVNISGGNITISAISATGTANSTTFLRGDGSWANVATGGGSGTVTSVNANSTVSGFTFTGGPVTASGTLTLTGPTPGTSGNVLTSDGTNWVSQTNSGSGIGTGQTWQAVTRTSGTTYYNTTGKPIQFKGDVNSSNNGTSSLTINGVFTGYQGSGYNASGTQWYCGAPVIIPAGASYVWTVSSGYSSYQAYELR